MSPIMTDTRASFPLVKMIVGGVTFGLVFFILLTYMVISHMYGQIAGVFTVGLISFAFFGTAYIGYLTLQE